MKPAAIARQRDRCAVAVDRAPARPRSRTAGRRRVVGLASLASVRDHVGQRRRRAQRASRASASAADPAARLRSAGRRDRRTRSSSCRRVTVCAARSSAARAAPRARAPGCRRRRHAIARRAGRAWRHSAAGVGEGDQVAGEVAAVDRRDVARLERPQVARVVPVVEVAAEALAAAPSWRASPRAARPCRACRSSRSRGPRPSTADRGRCWSARCGARRPAADLPGSCPAAACCRRRRRRSRRTARCAARSGAASRASAGATARAGAAARRAADPAARSPATRSQSSSEGQRRPARLAGASQRRRAAAASAEHDAAGHPPVEAAEVESRPTVACAAVIHSSRWRRRDEQPAQRADDRVDHQPGLVGEEGDQQRGLRRSASARSRAERAQVAAHRDAGAPRHERRERPAAASAARSSSRTKPRPDERGRQRQRPARRAARATAAGADSVRRRLSSIFQRPIAGMRAALPCRRLPRHAAEDPRQQLPVAARPAVLARGGDVVARRETPRTARRR